jgi:hypothetical protein
VSPKRLDLTIIFPTRCYRPSVRIAPRIEEKDSVFLYLWGAMPSGALKCVAPHVPVQPIANTPRPRQNLASFSQPAHRLPPRERISRCHSKLTGRGSGLACQLSGQCEPPHRFSRPALTVGTGPLRCPRSQRYPISGATGRTQKDMQCQECPPEIVHAFGFASGMCV